MDHRLFKYFDWAHLPIGLQSVSKPFQDLAITLLELHVTDSAEQTVALRKLLEAKDAAVRMMLK